MRRARLGRALFLAGLMLIIGAAAGFATGAWRAGHKDAPRPATSQGARELFLPTVTLSPRAYIVAPDGNDQLGAGSVASPWASVDHALATVPDGALILVAPGTYFGQVDARRVFTQGVTVRAAVPYQARLRHDRQVIACFFCAGIVFEGFDISHSGEGADRYVIQIQDARGDGQGGRRVTLRNNVLHDSYNNDILKINRGAQEILVTGNLFYNQSGQDSHIDLTSAHHVVIQDNVFFNDFAGSGRPDNQDTGSFIVIKDADGLADGNLGSHHIVLERNVFLHWSGGTGNGYIALGDGSATDYHHAYEILIENNLLLGNAGHVMHVPIKIVGSRDITFRHNTIAGDLPTKMQAFRLDSGGLANEGILFANNVWADDTGTMGQEGPADLARFSMTAQTTSVSLANNLYWNGGEAIPVDPAEPINFSDDPAGLLVDPALPADQAGIVPPRWIPGSGLFVGGEASIREVFVNLVRRYGWPAAGSAVVDAADPAQSPATDILGRPRGAPDVGAVERE